jgi:hypothetical protein
MATHLKSGVNPAAHLAGALDEWREPGASEVSECVRELLGDTLLAEGSARLKQLKPGVYRLRVGERAGPALVLKRHPPAVAYTDRLVAERWLPALGFGDRCPKLLAAAAEREGRWVWHVYEDLGDGSLADRRLPWRVGAAVDFIAALHVRAAGHPLVPEIRWRARDHGVHFLLATLRDAVAALEALADYRRDGPADFRAARAGRRRGVRAAVRAAPRRVGIMEACGAADTLLHGDLWPKNVFVTAAEDRPCARLIDWDHVGAGPFGYDVSTFLYRSSPEERPWILRRYREAVERAGWHLPGDVELNLLFHTTEAARYAHDVLFDAMAVLNDDAQWGVEGLIHYDRWFAALRPPLSAP